MSNNVFFVNESSAAQRLEAYIFLDENKDLAGMLHVLHPKDGSGRLRVTLYDWTDKGSQNSPSSSMASGWGYDKLAKAMSNLSFAGVQLQDHPNDWRKTLNSLGYKIIQAL